MAIQHFMTGLACLPPIEMRVTELTLQRCRAQVQQRPIDAHKGTMGHALLVAGSPGMAGAAVLASRACMRSGVGKCSVCTPRSNNDILQISVPEVIVAAYDSLGDNVPNGTYSGKGNSPSSEGWELDLGAYDAVGIGPGLGQSKTSEYVLKMVLSNVNSSVVVDADAINLIGKGVVPIEKLPQGMIFTPHKKEFERLLAHPSFVSGGEMPSGQREGLNVQCSMLNGQSSKATAAFPMDDVTRAMALAMDLKGYVLLKGHRSALCCHDGELIYNSTGNAGMATAGSGDVLTGIITGLLARGYEPKVAAMMGMYLHGLAGDMAAEEVGQECLIASDIIKWLPKAMGKVYGA